MDLGKMYQKAAIKQSQMKEPSRNGSGRMYFK
jgi:hypothetical protein